MSGRNYLLERVNQGQDEDVHKVAAYILTHFAIDRNGYEAVVFQHCGCCCRRDNCNSECNCESEYDEFNYCDCDEGMMGCSVNVDQLEQIDNLIIQFNAYLNKYLLRRRQEINKTGYDFSQWDDNPEYLLQCLRDCLEFNPEYYDELYDALIKKTKYRGKC